MSITTTVLPASLAAAWARLRRPAPALAAVRSARAAAGPHARTLTVLATAMPGHAPQVRVLRADGGCAHSRRMLELDALALVPQRCPGRPAWVWLHDRQLRAALTAQAWALPHLRIVADRSGHRAVDQACAAALAEALAHAQAELAERRRADEQAALLAAFPPVVVATDGSHQPGRAGAGLAWVSDDDRSWHGTLPETYSPLEAELAAIQAALRAHPHRRATVLTDCLFALWLIENPERDVPANRAARDLAAAIAAEKPAYIRLAYVKAHNGHRLNEAADALAKHARLELHRERDLAGRRAAA